MIHGPRLLAATTLTLATTVLTFVACGGTTARAPAAPAVPVATAPVDAPPAREADGHLAELEGPPARHLLAIDWASVHLASDADALALWRTISPTGDDWERKLSEVPDTGPIRRALAIALLRAGNFRCVPPPAKASCAPPPVEVPAPAPTATLDDPCLRRVLALWSLDQLDDGDASAVRDALRAIVVIPPPESQLVARALGMLPDDDQDGRLELLGIAWRAGQHELVDGALGDLDLAHLTAAATRLHVDGALDVLSAEGERTVYLGAVGDDRMATAARVQAIAELVAADAQNPSSPGAPPGIQPDLRRALVAATRARDCTVAAAAARALAGVGLRRYLPQRPHTGSTRAMMRAMCVLASYARLRTDDEPGLLPGFLPARGLELIETTYDPYGQYDDDGDGDPHTQSKVDLLPRTGALLPQPDVLVQAFADCSGTTCRTSEQEVRFTFKPAAGGLVLWRLELADLPPCHDPPAISNP